MTREITTDAEVLDRLLQPNGKLIVDVGCGGGALVRRLASLGAEAIGVEISEEQLAGAIAAEGVRYLVGRAEALPLDDGAADAVVFMRSLHHVPQPEMLASLREAARVLRPGGLVYVDEPLPEGDYFELVRVVEDELAVRLAAQRALDDAALAGLERATTVEYLVEVEIPDLGALRRRFVSVDPRRSTVFDAHADELAQAIGSGRRFLQPMRADLLSLQAASS